MSGSNKVIFMDEEFGALQGDLAKILDALKNGGGYAIQELEAVVERVAEKRANNKEYKQVVVD